MGAVMSEAISFKAAAASVLGEAWMAGWTPDPRLSVCEWADANIVLSSKSSANSGQFDSGRTPYVREILECLAPDSPVHTVVFVAGAQVAKSQSMFNYIGSIIDQYPGPVMMVQPTVDMAKRVSKQRLAPMFEETPVLKRKVVEQKSRDGSSTMLEKAFPGGFLVITGANSAASLRSMPVRYLLLDETDAYPQDVDGEGSPIKLAIARTSSFGDRRKIFMTSTPTIKGYSAIETEWLKTDQRKFYVPCPHCGEHDVITFDRLKFNAERLDDGVHLVCQHCGALIEETYKTQMLAAGEWRSTAEGSSNLVRGYHISALYSPYGWKSWRTCVEEFLEARGNPEKLKVWVNTVLGETWEEKGDGASPDLLKARREHYKAEVPDGVRILTCAVDVQKDRLEVKVKGYGADEESWLVAYTVLNGDPGQGDVWAELDEFLRTRFTQADGSAMAIDTTLIDSGGWHTNSVYRYCKSKGGQRIFPLKGHQFPGKAIVSNPSRNNALRVPLFIVGVDAAKDLVVARMQVGRPGPGYMHLPEWADDDYLAQLTAEKAVRKYIRGRGVVRQWIKAPSARNEAFDLEVYCLAALYTRGHNYLAKLLGTGNVVARKHQGEEMVDAADAADTPAKRPPPTPDKWGSSAPAAGPKWGNRVSSTGTWGAM